MMRRRLAGASSAEQENGQALRPESFDDPSSPVPPTAYAVPQRPLGHSDGVPHTCTFKVCMLNVAWQADFRQKSAAVTRDYPPDQVGKTWQFGDFYRRRV